MVAAGLVKATGAVLLPFMLLARRRLAALAGAVGGLVAIAVVSYPVFGLHGLDVISALNRDAALVSTDSFPNEIAHLLGKPGVFPADHTLLKVALVAIVAAPAVAHVAGVRLGVGVGLDAAGDRRDQHVAAGVVHAVGAAAGGGRARPAAADRDLRGAGPVHRPPNRPAVLPGFAMSGASAQVVPGDRGEREHRAERRRGARAVSGATGTVRPGRWERLPERLRPRTEERRGQGDLRRVESTLLVLAFLVLAVAVVNDVVRQVHVNERITADLRTWRTITGNDLKNISVEQDLTHRTTRDVLCGNTGSGPRGRSRRRA